MSKPVVSTAFQKRLNKSSIDGLLAIVFPPITVPDEAEVKASFIKMNEAAAAASMGSTTTAISFVTGACFFLARAGHEKLKGLPKELTPAAEFFVRTAYDAVLSTGARAGNGFTAGQVRHGIKAAYAAALAYKAPEKVEEPDPTPAPTPAPAATTAPAPDNTAAHAAAYEDAAAHGMAMDNTAAPAAYEAIVAAERAAIVAAEKKAAEAARAAAWREQQAAARLADVATEKAIAACEFRKLAEALGVKLTPAQVKALAALEHDHEAIILAS